MTHRKLKFVSDMLWMILGCRIWETEILKHSLLSQGGSLIHDLRW